MNGVTNQAEDQTKERTSMPDTREVLEEHLYQKVCELCQAETNDVTLPGKLTGMLLECHTRDILCMLTDNSLLTKRISAARDFVIVDQTEPSSHENSDNRKLDLGCQLFQQISQMESSLCAQITGMLMEMDSEILEDLLKDSEKLKSAVEKSKTAFLKYQQGCDNVNSSREEVITLTSTEAIGEELYNQIEPVHPEQAAKITGMLLEIDRPALLTVLQNPQLMWEKVSIAREALLKNTTTVQQSHCDTL